MAKTTTTSVSATASSFSAQLARLAELQLETETLKKSLLSQLGPDYAKGQVAASFKPVKRASRGRPSGEDIRVNGITRSEFIRNCDPALSIKEVQELGRNAGFGEIGYHLVYQVRLNAAAKAEAEREAKALAKAERAKAKAASEKKAAKGKK